MSYSVLINSTLEDIIKAYKYDKEFATDMFLTLTEEKNCNQVLNDKLKSRATNVLDFLCQDLNIVEQLFKLNLKFNIDIMRYDENEPEPRFSMWLKVNPEIARDHLMLFFNTDGNYISEVRDKTHAFGPIHSMTELYNQAKENYDNYKRCEYSR